MSRLDEIERWLHLREKNEPVPESMVQNIDWLIQKLKECIPYLELIKKDTDWCECMEEKAHSPCIHNKVGELLKELRGEK